MADHTYTAGEEPTAASLNEWIRDQVITICTSATRPSSGGPVEGRTIFETDTNYFLVYDGSNWVLTPGAYVSATAPTNKVAGTVHFDADDDTARVWNGSAWKGLGVSILTGSSGANTIPSSTYCGLASSSSTEAAVQFAVPYACSLSKFYATVASAPTAGKSYTATVRKNGSNTALTCTIADAATTGSDTSNAVAFAAGDLLSIGTSGSGAPGNVGMQWSVRMTVV